MSLSLFIFRGQSKREPASVICDEEQCDLVYSADPHRKQNNNNDEHDGYFDDDVSVCSLLSTAGRVQVPTVKCTVERQYHIIAT